jgi:hypothetical protein
MNFFFLSLMSRETTKFYSEALLLLLLLLELMYGGV